MSKTGCLDYILFLHFYDIAKWSKKSVYKPFKRTLSSIYHILSFTYVIHPFQILNEKQ